MAAKNYSDKAIFLLRLALGGLFLYFGILAVLNPEEEMSAWMATWVQSIPVIGTPEFIFLLGTAQIIVGLCLVLGVYVRYAALAAAALLIGVIVNLGFNDITYRDIVIFAAALVLATHEKHKWTLYPR